MKESLLFIVLIFFFADSFAQCNGNEKNKISAKDISFINNNKIKYSIAIVSCDTCVPISNIGSRVIVTMSEKEMKTATTIDCETWMKLLENDKSDWAANLILYCIKNRDAAFLARRNNRENWVKYFKNDDIEYWKNVLQQDK